MENGKKFKVQSSEMGPWPVERHQSTKDVRINESEVKWKEHDFLLQLPSSTIFIFLATQFYFASKAILFSSHHQIQSPVNTKMGFL